MESERNAMDTQEDAETSVDNLEEGDVWSQIVKNKSIQEKYKIYVESIEIYTEQESSKKKRRTVDSAVLDSPKEIKKYRFLCKLCKKNFVGMLGSTSNIRSHLKVS